jgi:aspartate/methionine/tyrosine aminotransferase
VVSSPANPTGAIQPPETMQALAGLGPVVISDEIYDGLVYDGAQVHSALEFEFGAGAAFEPGAASGSGAAFESGAASESGAAFEFGAASEPGSGAASGSGSASESETGHADEVAGQAFVLDGFSKRYSMTGFRLGWVVAPEWAARPMQVLQQSLFICASEFAQIAGQAALEVGGEAAETMRAIYQLRRDRLVEGLRRLGFGIPHSPQGALYAFADARRFCGSGGAIAGSRELAFALLERAGVGATPGIDFGAAGEGWLRFCFAVEEATIDEALERMAPVLEEFEAAAQPAARRGGA